MKLTAIPAAIAVATALWSLTIPAASFAAAIPISDAEFARDLSEKGALIQVIFQRRGAIRALEHEMIVRQLALRQAIEILRIYCAGELRDISDVPDEKLIAMGAVTIRSRIDYSESKRAFQASYPGLRPFLLTSMGFTDYGEGFQNWNVYERKALYQLQSIGSAAKAVDDQGELIAGAKSDLAAAQKMLDAAK